MCIASLDLEVRQKNETELVELLILRLNCTDVNVLSKQEGKARLCCWRGEMSSASVS